MLNHSQKCNKINTLKLYSSDEGNGRETSINRPPKKLIFQVPMYWGCTVIGRASGETQMSTEGESRKAKLSGKRTGEDYCLQRPGIFCISGLVLCIISIGFDYNKSLVV
jgi:hypothetical protein